MDLLTALAIVAGFALVALVFMLVVVVLSRINALHKNGHDKDKKFHEIMGQMGGNCPKCQTALWAHTDFFEKYSPYRGINECPKCRTMYKRYSNGPLIEVFGTPVNKEGGTHDDKDPHL